jgi:hypothetical protein
MIFSRLLYKQSVGSKLPYHHSVHPDFMRPSLLIACSRYILTFCAFVGLLSSCRSIASTYISPNFNTYQTAQTLGERRSEGITAVSAASGIQTTAQNFALSSQMLYSLESYTSAQFGITPNLDLGGSLAFSVAGANNESIELDGSTGLRLFAKLGVTDSATAPFAMAFLLGGAIIDGSKSSSVDKHTIHSSMRYVELGIPMSVIFPNASSFTIYPRLLLGQYSFSGIKAEGFPKFIDPFAPIGPPIPPHITFEGTTFPYRKKFIVNQQREEQFESNTLIIVPSISFGLRAFTLWNTNVAIHPELTISHLQQTWAATFGVSLVMMSGY